MNKTDFLKSPDVDGFIRWLATDLGFRTFKLDLASSRFVPGGLKTEAKGIEAVLMHYHWKAKWTDTRSGLNVESDSWIRTKDSLSKLSKWLRESVRTGNQEQTLDASMAVLQWGGVSGASKLVKELCKTRELVAYLRNVQALLAVNGPPSQRTEDITAEKIKKFDSGLTKIHALLDGDGSPIYDSRVAGAISLLYSLYREACPKSLVRSLEFPCGSARGDQLRNPGDLGFKRAKALYSETAHYEWAQTQLKLGWIFWGLLTQYPTLFQNEGNLAARAHALEASLFMVGYDLRCFGVRSTRILKSQTPVRTFKVRNFGMVPTVHPFEKVMNEFIRIRRTRKALSHEDFPSLMFKNKALKPSTRKAYLFPLKETEFDLCDLRDNSIEELENDRFGWLKNWFEPQGFELPDERKHVCLIDAWLVGYLNRNFEKTQHLKILQNAGFAGTNNAATAIQSVGRSVGKFFKLLDQDGLPTENFGVFFRDVKDLVRELPESPD